MTQLEQNNRLKKLAIVASISVSLSLIIFKFIAFIKTDSLAVFSSLVDSATDLFSSAISFIAVYYSMKPASHHHRYGYGKTEAISALMQAIFVGASGVFVIFDGINRLFNPVSISSIGVGIYIMLISILATLFLVLYQIYVAKKTQSLAIKADMAHYVVDFLTNSTVIISLFLVKFLGFVYFDIISALFISLYLLYNAYTLAKESIEQLTDKELDDDIRNNISKLVLECDNVLGMHDLRTRSIANIYYIEFHLEINGNTSLLFAHQISENVENKILDKYPSSQILIHQDPYGIKEDRLDNKINV
jgi:ferrous-iron efflux pump FieF